MAGDPRLVGSGTRAHVNGTHRESTWGTDMRWHLAGRLGAALGFTLAVSSPAFAQFGGGASGGAATGIDSAAQRTIRGARQVQKPAIPPPPVLPGTKGSSEVAMP